MNRYELNARNLLCPMPVIRTQNKMAELRAGDILEVYCSDPGALQDIPTWCRINGHEVLESRTEAGDIILILRAGGSAEPA
ncbi:MAG: sulfurtransferase TusA family protein [Acidiferrobacterales bacterium]